MMSYVTLVAGFLLLLAGGEGLVRGAVGLSHRLGISKAFIGVAVVGFGTSMPELVVSIKAALIERPGLAAGNVIGSNIANILLILGLAALISPQQTSSLVLRRDGTFLLVATVALVAALNLFDLGLIAGILMLVAFALFLGWCFLSERKAQDESESDDPEDTAGYPWPVGVALTGAGVAGLALGASLFVSSAAEIAEGLGVPPAIIGLSIVAVGTSLPELVASLMAARKGQAELVIGNIIGSNVFNLLMILGVTVVMAPLSLSQIAVRIDLWFMLGSTVLLILFLRTGLRVSRVEAAILLAGYLIYCWRLASAF